MDFKIKWKDYFAIFHRIIMFERYAYSLPEERIAQAPARPRDSCKLLIYKSATDSLIIDRFFNIGDFLPSESFLVMNNTAVVPARLYCSSDTKKRVEVFILSNELRPNDIFVRCMVDRRIIPGQTLYINNRFSFRVHTQNKQYFMLKPNFSMELLPYILKKYGTTPIPKYIRKTPLTEKQLRKKYQTVFAQTLADGQSVAAPTASLHFTHRLLSRLSKKHIQQLMVTLHVGLGTFAPLNQENIDTKKLAYELYEVSTETAATIQRYKKAMKPLIAVGTTAIRTLESYAKTSEYQDGAGIRDRTDLFILPPYTFMLADGLITNFHLPNSSLMMLVDAFLQHKKAKKTIQEIYTYALKEKFSFYSFGDALLIL